MLAKLIFYSLLTQFNLHPPDLEVLYNDDPRLRKYPITTAPPSRYHESDVDFSDPDVVDQIMQTADFYDLYERYAD